MRRTRSRAYSSTTPSTCSALPKSAPASDCRSWWAMWASISASSSSLSLSPADGEELDAVVAEGIVGGADDDAGVGAVLEHERGEPGRRHDAGDLHARAAAGEAGSERRLQHRPAEPRVAADDEQRVRTGLLCEHDGRGPADLYGELGGQQFAGDAADAVRAEVRAQRSVPAPKAEVYAEELRRPPHGDRRHGDHQRRRRGGSSTCWRAAARPPRRRPPAPTAPPRASSTSGRCCAAGAQDCGSGPSGLLAVD